MKKSILRAIPLSVIGILVCFALDAILGKEVSPVNYILLFVFISILLSVGFYLDARGWNSWKKVCSLFGKKSK